MESSEVGSVLNDRTGRFGGVYASGCAGGAFAGLVRGIGRGEGGVYGCLPGVQPLEHVGGLVGNLLREVISLAKVFFQVEEQCVVVFKVFDEFEVADADGGAGPAALIAVVRVVPEERALRERLTFEEG